MPNMTEVKIPRLPACDICTDGTLAHYDAATIHGPWGYLCERHFAAIGVGLGTGRGQRLVLAG